MASVCKKKKDIFLILFYFILLFLNLIFLGRVPIWKRIRQTWQGVCVQQWRGSRGTLKMKRMGGLKLWMRDRNRSALWVPEDHLWCQIRLWIWSGHQKERWYWHCVNGASLFWNSTGCLLSFLDLVSANLYFPRDMDVDAEGQGWMCLLHGVKQWDHNVWIGQEQSDISLEWVRHYHQFSEHPRTLVLFSIQSKILW